MNRALGPGVAFAVATFGIATFSCMDAVMKGLVLAIGIYVTLLWRSITGSAISGIIYAAQGPRRPTPAVLRLHLIRGTLTAAMATMFFWGLARVPMAQAVALAFIAPLIAVLLAALILKEKVGPGTILGSVVALGGVVVILGGQAQGEYGDGALAGAIAVLLSAVCYAFNIILMRQQALVAGPFEIAFYQNLVVAVLLAAAIPFMAGVVPPLAQAPMILLAAILSTASNVLLSWAYRHAEASYLSATEYTAFVWAAIFGFVLFGEHLSLYTIAGAVLIVAGCIVVARRRAGPQIEAAL